MQQPNFIFILADDLGYADLGCCGARDSTLPGGVSPHLDRLAREGMLFTDGYSNSPVCSPTRFALATGRYQYRLRGAAEEPLAGSAKGNPILGLPPAHPTLPSMLRDAGYATALIGKWHLGYRPHFGPEKSGYQQFFGPMAGGVDYFSHCARNGDHDLWEGEAQVRREGYLTDLLSERAVQFVQQQKGRPFLLSLHYTAPHWPWLTRDDADESKRINGAIAHLDGGSIATYRRMIHHMDEGIGWVAEALEKNGQLDNTLIVFTSDNGGERFSDTWPLAGGKMDLTEGGIRVPWVAHWPAVIAHGSTSRQHCLTMDWSATMLAAAGASAHADYPLDGVSLLPVLEDVSHEFRRPMHWRMKHREQRALRDGDWKYLKVDEHEYLFNIAQDERERANLAAREPARLAALRDDWQAWNTAIGAIAQDASVSLVYGLKDMPQR